MTLMLGELPERTDLAACGLYLGRLPATELPGHGVRSCLVSCVIGMPRPEVATPPICLRFIACTTACRTRALDRARPAFWLKKNSSGNPMAIRLKMLLL